MATPFHVMTKPIGAICNLDCKYCFYLDKKGLYPDQKNFKMEDAVLDTYIRDYIASQSTPEVSFAWQGGEPTLMGLDYFKKVVELQEKYSGGKKVANAIQTNGTLLDKDWAVFLKKHEFLVGISIDGPAESHDLYRVDKRGNPTYDAVMRGLDLLKKYEVEFNTLTVVSRANEKHGLEVYRFLKEIGSGFMQFIPLVEREEASGEFAPPPHEAKGRRQIVSPMSVGASAYGEFMVAIFDEWVRKDVGSKFVQLFDVSLGIWVGQPAGLCLFARECGSALALEHSGDLYSCDHFVYPEYRLGNIMDDSIAGLAGNAKQAAFGKAKGSELPEYCRSCEVRFACNGECPKNRFTNTLDGKPGLNYLCPSYKRFFKHVDPAMKAMGRLLRQRKPAADIMALVGG